MSKHVTIKPVIITEIVSNIQLLLAARTLKCNTAHDDLAIAAGLAAWAAATDFPEPLRYRAVTVRERAFPPQTRSCAHPSSAIRKCSLTIEYQ